MEDAVKRFVWPTLETLTTAIAAVALVKIVLFPSQGDGATADISPGYAVDIKTTLMIEGSTSNTVSVEGRIVQDVAAEIQAGLTNMVDSVTVEKDTQISAGDPLLYIKHSKSQPLVTETDESDNVTQTPTEDKVTWSAIYAPVSGTVTPKVLKQQKTGVDVVMTTITSATYLVTGTVSAAQQCRLTSTPTAATLTLEGDSAPLQCNNLKTGTKASASTTTGGGGSTMTTSGDGTNVETRCAVPDDQEVFVGMPVTISVGAGSALEILMVPVTAVEGKVGSGFVWLVPESGDTSKVVKTAVKLGVTDGMSIQVTVGLKADQQVLQFTPNKGTCRTGTPGTYKPDNSACYDPEGKEVP